MADSLYIAHLTPSEGRFGDPVTIEITNGKLIPVEKDITVRLLELDSFSVDQVDGGSKWVEDEGGAGKKNPDDPLCEWSGEIHCDTVDGAPSFKFVPLTFKLGPKANDSYATRVPVRIEHTDYTWNVPIPVDQERQVEGPTLELGVTITKGGQEVYKGSHSPSLVRDWHWWAQAAFSQPRPGNSVKVYIDAIEYFGDLAAEMAGAKRSIYILGWALDPRVQLVRPGGPRLFEALRDAAQRGVKVKIIITESAPQFLSMLDLDDAANQSWLMAYPNIELMRHRPNPNWFARSDGTDEERPFWTHHQKNVMIDDRVAFVGGIDLADGRYDDHDHTLDRVEEGDEHAWLTNDLKWKTSQTEHYLKQRMPWHDVHSRLEGPSARTVVRNFIERWNGERAYAFDILTKRINGPDSDYETAVLADVLRRTEKYDPYVFQLFTAMESSQSTTYNGYLQLIQNIAMRDTRMRKYFGWLTMAMRDQGEREEIPAFQPIEPKPAPEDLPRAGNVTVQVVRSAQANTLEKVAADRIQAQTGADHEHSILDVYRNAIAKAENYIYIENQIFISHVGPDAKEDADFTEMSAGGRSNDIAQRLREKITTKMTRKEPFSVTIILPEIYDGDPFETSGTGIQHLQWQTITELLRLLQKPADANGVKVDDYIKFYALRSWGLVHPGKEPKRDDVPGVHNGPGDAQWSEEGIKAELEKLKKAAQGAPVPDPNRAKVARVNVCYVHTKLMIVDDLFLTVGSANINDRSMKGDRDSEINLAIQDGDEIELDVGDPAFKTGPRKLRKWKARQLIHETRMRLWLHHLGYDDGDPVAETLKNPTSPATIKLWHERAKQNHNFSTTVQTLYQSGNEAAAAKSLQEYVDKKMLRGHIVPILERAETKGTLRTGMHFLE